MSDINSIWFRILPKIIYFLIEIRNKTISVEFMEAEKADAEIYLLWEKTRKIKLQYMNRLRSSKMINLIEDFLHQLVIKSICGG